MAISPHNKDPHKGKTLAHIKKLQKSNSYEANEVLKTQFNMGAKELINKPSSIVTK